MDDPSLLFNNLEEGCACVLSVGSWKYFSGCWVISKPILNKNSYNRKGVKIEVKSFVIFHASIWICRESLQ